MIASLETQETRAQAKETKFLVSPAVASQIREWARQNLSPDPEAVTAADDVYTVTSLYLDTPSLDIFFRNKNFGRSKYRIRRYGSSEMIFLERKLRTNKLLAKHRSRIPLGELALLEEGQTPGWIGDWFQRRMLAKRLWPVCKIAYERTARVGNSLYGPIRLTLDENLRATPVSSLGFPTTETPWERIEAGKVVLELKYRTAISAKFKELAARFQLAPVPFSKYRATLPRVGVVDAFCEMETKSPLEKVSTYVG
ncbi:MAG: polyphosphate polymerase domain-containing protein [Puniceicoccales bacterium]|jgi:hypothetical protein|nr:polyphosphate polymerase domain-containing protein [Puniceicoccales bacterium]